MRSRDRRRGVSPSRTPARAGRRDWPREGAGMDGLGLVSRFGSSSHPEIAVIASVANPGVRRGSARGAKLSLDCFVALRAPRNDKCFPDVVNFRTRTLPPPQEAAELAPRARVEHVGALDPAAPRLIDAEAHEIELAHAVRVGRDRELDARLLGKPRMDVVEVEALGLGVDLEEAAALL